MSRSFSFLDQHAVAYGLEEAVLIKSFESWISGHRRDPTRHLDGRTWVYWSVKEAVEYWTFLKNTKRAQRALDSLVKRGILLRATAAQRRSLNERARRDKWLQVAWYAFADEQAFLGWETCSEEESAMIPKMGSSGRTKMGSPKSPLLGRSSKVPHGIMHGINNNNNASPRDPCDLPVAVVVAPPPSAPDPTPAPDPDALARLTDEHLFNGTLTAQLAAGWTGEEMAAWIALGKQKARDLGDYLRVVLADKSNPPPRDLQRRREREAKAAILAEQIAARDRQREQAEAADPELARKAAQVEAELERRRQRRLQQQEGASP